MVKAKEKEKAADIEIEPKKKENVAPSANEISDSGRRNFIKAMGIIAVGAGLALTLRGVVQSIIPASVGISGFPTLTLVDQSGNPIHTSSLKVNNPAIVVFNYPLQNEPNFLLRLGDSSNNDVAIPGGVSVSNPGGSSYASLAGQGPYKSVVASSAICQHLGCQPPNIKFYPPSSSTFPGLIECHCHGSQYDPYKGFGVVKSPTQFALPSVVIGWDSSTDTYQVSNMIGPTIHGHASDLTGGTPLTSTSSTAIYNVT